MLDLEVGGNLIERRRLPRQWVIILSAIGLHAAVRRCLAPTGMLFFHSVSAGNSQIGAAPVYQQAVAFSNRVMQIGWASVSLDICRPQGLGKTLEGSRRRRLCRTICSFATVP